jgi:hypothetical protein
MTIINRVFSLISLRYRIGPEFNDIMYELSDFFLWLGIGCCDRQLCLSYVSVEINQNSFQNILCVSPFHKPKGYTHISLLHLYGQVKLALTHAVHVGTQRAVPFLSLLGPRTSLIPGRTQVHGLAVRARLFRHEE